MGGISSEHASKARLASRCIKALLADRRIGHVPQAVDTQTAETRVRPNARPPARRPSVIETHARHRRFRERARNVDDRQRQSSCNAASAGVLSAAMMPSPRQPRRSSTDSASDSGDVMYDQLQPCSAANREHPVMNTSWWAPRGKASAISLARFAAMKYNAGLANASSRRQKRRKWDCVFSVYYCKKCR